MIATTNEGRTSAAVRILLVEDEAGDARLIEDLLIEQGVAYELDRVTRIGEAVERLKDPGIDVVLLDLHLPDSRGLQTLATAHAGAIGQPIIVLTGRGFIEMGVQALRLGAQDFLVKEDLEPVSLARAIRHAIERQRMLGCMRDSVRASIMSETNLRGVLLGGPEALVVIESRDHVVFTNEAAESMFGRTAECIRARPFEFRLALGVESEVLIHRPDGTQVKAEMRVVDVIWEQKPARLASLRNVTEQRNAAEQLMRLDMLTSFLGNVSHELRTPLTAIYQCVSNTRDGLLGPIGGEQREHLGVALRNVDEVLAMVANLLDVARAEAGKFRIDLQIVELQPELTMFFDVWRASAREHQLHFSVDVPARLPRLVVDPARLRQVIANLVENAVKFTGAGGSVALSARPEPDGQFIRITVSDTGVGVAPEHLDRIFDQMEQVPDTLYRTRRGLGLGLYITRDLVRRQGGEIQVVSEPGKGSAFHVLLPAFDLPATIERLLQTREAARSGVSMVQLDLGGSRDEENEPTPDGPARRARELLQEVVQELPHVVLPRWRRGATSVLIALVAAEPGVATQQGEILRNRLASDPVLGEFAVESRVDIIPFTAAPDPRDPLSLASLIEVSIERCYGGSSWKFS